MHCVMFVGQLYYMMSTITYFMFVCQLMHCIMFAILYSICYAQFETNFQTALKYE